MDKQLRETRNGTWWRVGLCLKGQRRDSGRRILADSVEEDRKKAPLYSKCTRVKAGCAEVGWAGGAKSVQNQDLKAERNKNARHTGHLEVENTAAKLNE